MHAQARSNSPENTTAHVSPNLPDVGGCFANFVPSHLGGRLPAQLGARALLPRAFSSPAGALPQPGYRDSGTAGDGDAESDFFPEGDADPDNIGGGTIGGGRGCISVVKPLRSRSAALAGSAVSDALVAARGGRAAVMMPAVPSRPSTARAAGGGSGGGGRGGRSGSAPSGARRANKRASADVNSGSGGEGEEDAAEAVSAAIRSQASALGVSPKRMKRILANRKSAAAAKARKTKYYKVGI